MFAFRLPRVAAVRPALLTAGVLAVLGTGGLAAGASEAQAWNYRWISSGTYYNWVLMYADRQPIWEATIDNTPQCYIYVPGCNDIACVWAQNSPHSSTLAPSAYLVRYSEDYWHTYGTAPPSEEGDLAGQETCVQNASDYHPYNGTSIRVGMNYKSGLPTSGDAFYGGMQKWN